MAKSRTETREKGEQMFQNSLRKMMFVAGALSAGAALYTPAQAAVEQSYCAECEAASLRAELPLTTTAAQLVYSGQIAANQVALQFPAVQATHPALNATPFQMNPYWTAQSNSAQQASATFGSSFFNGYTGQVNMANLCSFWSANIPAYSDAFDSCAVGADTPGQSVLTASAPTLAPLFPNKIPDSTDVDTNISLQI
jgi:hypothetical protein